MNRFDLNHRGNEMYERDCIEAGPTAAALSPNMTGQVGASTRAMSGQDANLTSPPTVFDELTIRMNEQEKRVYQLRDAFGDKLNRLIGTEPQDGSACSDRPTPTSALDNTVIAMDDLCRSITALENELARINRLVGE